MTQYLENYLPPIQSAGLNTKKAALFAGGITGTDQLKATQTNGTTPVSVFGTTGLGFAATITGVFVISNDITAGNITVENPAGTVVATVAKGTTAGVMTGAVTLANTALAAGTNLVVNSSSAGNAQVFITYKV